jgi:hypothetical protein
VSQADHDEFLELFSRHDPKEGEAARWLGEWLKEKRMKQQDIRDMEGYDEMYLKAMPIEKRLEGLAPERVLSAYAPEQRLAGLNRDQQALALPVEMLRGLTEEYILSLSPETQEEVRRRLQRGSH